MSFGMTLYQFFPAFWRKRWDSLSVGEGSKKSPIEDGRYYSRMKNTNMKPLTVSHDIRSESSIELLWKPQILHNSAAGAIKWNHFLWLLYRYLFSIFFKDDMRWQIVIIISIRPLGQFGQEPEPSQVTGMALVCCILGKFLGLVCHCFPPHLDVPTFAARCLHLCNDARDPSSERWNYWRERLSSNFAYIASLFTPLGIFYMPQIYNMGPMALLLLRRKACWGFFRP